MVKNKKQKHVLRPWCWYCERDFEDEKVLMQHQKAKHFKCGHCPRKLNTAGGLAVHIQQVHKLDPEPIENALPGRNGYDVEIFGMEGIPAADVAAYKRRKESELGLAPGTFGHAPGMAPPNQRVATHENRIYSAEELKARLATHIALMGGGPEDPNAAASSGPVLHAAPTTYALPPPMPGLPPMPPPGMPFPPPGMGLPPFAPGGMPPFPPGMPFPPPGFPMPPPSALLAGAPPHPGPIPAFVEPPKPAPPLAISKPPSTNVQITTPNKGPFEPTSLGLKENTDLKWRELDRSPWELRAAHPKYKYEASGGDVEMADGTSSKRARALDFLD